jgi:hypothetical protein
MMYEFSLVFHLFTLAGCLFTRSSVYLKTRQTVSYLRFWTKHPDLEQMFSS